MNSLFKAISKAATSPSALSSLPGAVLLSEMLPATGGAGAVTVGTAWARVESGDHYPSDVLVGMALGNFVGAVFAQVFLGREPDANLAFGAEPVRGGAMLHWEMRF